MHIPPEPCACCGRPLSARRRRGPCPDLSSPFSIASALTTPPAADVKTSGGDWLNELPAAFLQSEIIGLNEAARVCQGAIESGQNYR